MALPQLTFWTRSLAEERGARIAGAGERQLADGTVADRVTVRRVVQTTATTALDGVVDVVAETVGGQEDAAQTAKAWTALGLSFAYFGGNFSNEIQRFSGLYKIQF